MSSTPLASYGFLPWIRRGVGSRITRADGTALAQPEPRATLTIGIEFNTGALATSLDLYIAGPGEVAGIDPRAVRPFPDRDVHDAEPNYFPALKVSLAELPWGYTAAKATAGERLTPWCALICLADTEVAEYRASGADGQLAVVRVADASVLPPWNQLWAWVHAQVSGNKAPSADEIPQILENEPKRIVARFLCPRRLDLRTAYRAFLVPTFERGRLAGLAREVPETLDALTPAWTGASQDLELPVLYEWRFQTGVAEDFEYLARQLKPFVAPAEVGRRNMSVSQAGLGLPPAAGYPLALEGALRAPGSQSTDWQTADRQAFVPPLATLLNLPDSLTIAPGVPVVAPTLYGRWHALQKRLLTAANVVPRWFHQLNADPRLRVTAALGTLVVQREQRRLMASAWEQVGPIREINEERRQKQLAKLAASRLYARHWRPLDAESTLSGAAPVLARILASPRTVMSVLRASPIAPAMLDPQMKRMARPLGPFGRRQERDTRRGPRTLLSRINRGELASRRGPPVPQGVVTPRVAGSTLTTVNIPSWIRWLVKHLWWFVAAVVALAILAAFVIGLVALAVGAIVIGAAYAAIALSKVRHRLLDQDRRTGIIDGTLSGTEGASPAAEISTVNVPNDFVVSLTPVAVGPPPPPTRRVNGATQFEQQAAAAFQRAAVAVLDDARRAPEVAAELIPIDLPGVAAKVLAGLDPAVTIAAGMKDRLKTKPGVVVPADPVDEVMAAPEFPQPMYEPLRDLGQDWLLPGLEKVPANSVCLLETNQANFVEPYMLGLSCEMARELLWNKYPTDQRGTYFRQFWDVRGYVAPSGQTIDPEQLKDIKPIHQWNRQQPLGVNSSRQLTAGAGQLVLLIRGDLLRRYPDTIIYAVRAVKDAAGQRNLGDEDRHPLFRGTLKPDVTFVGFDLTESEARGGRASGGDPGWFFVFQEQPSEPRFGLDVATVYGGVPASWNDLSWGHLANDDVGLKAIRYIDLAAALPQTVALENDPNGPVWRMAGGPRGSRSSDLASITLQVPVRIAIHASTMLSGGAP
jgi:hypothetical protein